MIIRRKKGSHLLYKTQNGNTICFDHNERTMLTTDFQNGIYQIILIWKNADQEIQHYVLGEYSTPAAMDSAMGSILTQERNHVSPVVVPE